MTKNQQQCETRKQTKHSSRMASKRLIPNSVRLLRWSFILVCLGFVSFGWIQSANKYLSKQTAISIVKKNYKSFRYPSISFCPGFKNYSNLVSNLIIPEMKAKNLTRLDQLDLKKLIEPWIVKRTDILTLFSHKTAADFIFNDSYWEESIPHPLFTGQCFTYNPNFESPPGWQYSIRFGVAAPSNTSSHLDDMGKEKSLLSLSIFIHDKGRFFFSEIPEYDRPSLRVLESASLKYSMQSLVSLKYSRYTALSTKENPCSDDLDYDFRKCVEIRYSKFRGCQPPWYYFPEVDIPLCNDLKVMVNNFTYHFDDGLAEEYLYLPMRSTNDISDITGCPVPCTTNDWDYDIEYKDIEPWRAQVLNGPKWIVYLSFRKFFFEYSSEYVICDYTCLLGEIGGNLGFFLGGSLLAYIDTVLHVVLAKRFY